MVDWRSSRHATYDGEDGSCLALIHNDVSGVQLVRSYANLGQNAAFLLFPHGNSVPAHPDFDQGIEKIIFFLRFPGLFSGKCTPE